MWKMTGNTTLENIFTSNSGGMGTLKELGPTEAMTISCGIVVIGPIEGTESIDMGVIINYKPWPLSFVKKRRVFRFVAIRAGNELNWYDQPSGDLEKALDKFLAHRAH